MNTLIAPRAGREGDRELWRGRGRRVEGSAGGYRVRRWSCAGEMVLAVEAEPGSPLPPYAERRWLRGGVLSSTRSRLMLFTDAARLSGVWSWTNREESGPLVYRERSWDSKRPRRPPASVRLAEANREARGSPKARRAVRVTLLALLPRGSAEVVGPHPECADPGQLLQDMIEGTESAQALRRIWRSAARLRVLDPACQSGEWLVGAGEAFALVYLACLERMESFLADAGRSGMPARRTKLRDFRMALAVADDTRRWPSRRRYARELALCRNLRGACAGVVEEATVAARLERWVRGGAAAGPGAPLLPLLLRVGRPDSVAAGSAEEVEAVQRAAELLQRAWLEEGAAESAAVDAARAVRARLDALGAADVQEGHHLIRRTRR